MDQRKEQKSGYATEEKRLAHEAIKACITQGAKLRLVAGRAPSHAALFSDAALVKGQPTRPQALNEKGWTQPDEQACGFETPSIQSCWEWFGGAGPTP
jgi:hypothetical protein